MGCILLESMILRDKSIVIIWKNSFLQTLDDNVSVQIIEMNTKGSMICETVRTAYWLLTDV